MKKMRRTLGYQHEQQSQKVTEGLKLMTPLYRRSINLGKSLMLIAVTAVTLDRSGWSSV